jgi:hypothetical protein
MALDVEKPKTRRAILAAGLGGLGAVAAQALSHPSPADAVTNGNIQLGQGVGNTDNDCAVETRINGINDGQTVFSAFQNGSGVGLYGFSVTGRAVQAIGSTTATAYWAQSNHGPGVDAWSADSAPSTFIGTSHRTGVIGKMGDQTNAATNTDETGVYGYADASNSSTGVVGHSHQGFGVFGVGAVGVAGAGSWGVLGDVAPTQIGIYGNTGASAAPLVAGGIGVLARAESTAQIALKVIGKTAFSRSGRTYVAAGQSNRVIALAGVTTASYVIATMATNRAGVYVQSVVVAAGQFTIFLNKVVPGNTYVAYLVIN